MISLRKSQERGHANHGWLEAYHSFSFADFFDPKWMGFRNLRVINEDRIQPAEGFGTHAHKDMEIITYMLEGALEHKDSMGNGSVIRPGEVQYMSAGAGVTHSEFNASKTEVGHLLQIWILPNQKGLKPRYYQKNFPREARKNKACLLVAPDDLQDSGAIKIRQDVKLYGSLLEEGKSLSIPYSPKRFGWVQLAGGKIEVNGTVLDAGDAAITSEVETLTLRGLASESQVLIFDLN